MKYVITINQGVLHEMGMTGKIKANHIAVMDVIASMMTSSFDKILENKTIYVKTWYKVIAEELSFFDLSTHRIRQLLVELEEFGFVIRHPDNQSKGCLFLALGKSYLAYQTSLESYRGVANKLTGGRQEINEGGRQKINDNPNTNNPDTNPISLVEFAALKLNEYTKSEYKPDSKLIVKYVKILEKQSFTKEDIDLVIRFKTKEWLNNADMRQYLRPETLFGSHFESYLQAAKLAGKVEVPVQVVDVMSGDEAKAEYQRIITKGLKVATKQELEWVYDYQHRRDDWYITQIRAEEKLINRGENRTMEDAMNYPTKTV